MDSNEMTAAQRLKREEEMQALHRSVADIRKTSGLTPQQMAMPSTSNGDAFGGLSVEGSWWDEASDVPRDTVAAAAATRRVYMRSTKPLEIGQVKIKSFQCAVIPPAGREDPTWLNRCADYWELQMALYGYRVGGMTIDFDVVEGMNIITTSARIIDVLPGDRTDSRVDWAADRLKNGPSQR